MGLESKVVEDVSKDNEPQIDREKTCPLLLRVFCNYTGRHNSRSDYNRSNVPSNELQIYTWLDATLREITNLITEVNPEAKRKGTYFNFMVSYPNPNGPGFRMREIGSTTSGKRGPDDKSSLQSKRFVVGDYLDVAITYASRNGSLEHRSAGSSSNRRMRPY